MNVGTTLGGMGTGAAEGALVGSIVPGIGTAIGAGVGGLIGGIGGFFSGQQADAQQQIAEDQLQEAKSERAAATGFAAPTLQEMQAMQTQLSMMNNTYSLQTAALERDTRLAASIDPNILNTMNQAYQLSMGQDAPVLAPYRDIMKTQEQQTRSQLEKQLGPGWETSSVGQQAMQNWQQSSAMQGAQLQQQALGQMGQLGTQLSAMRPNVMGEVNQAGQTLSGMNQGLFGMSDSIQKRQIAASEGTPTMGYQGAGSVGQLVNSTNMGNMANQGLSTGMTLGGMQLMKKMGVGQTG